MSIIQNYKTVEEKERKYKPSRLPQARNPIYQKSVNVTCELCTHVKSRKKNYGTLYKLYRHFTYHHPYEPRYKEITMNLADQIINEDLK